MYRTRFIFGVTALFLAAGVAVGAQRGQGAGPKPQHATAPTAPHSSPKTVTKPTMTAPKSMKPASAPKTTMKPAQAPKMTTKAAPAPKAAAPVKMAKTEKPSPVKVAKTEKSAPTLAKPEKTANAAKAKTTTTTTTTTTATTTAPGTTTLTLTPVQQKLQKNTNLAAKLTSRLGGADLMTAAAGFRNLGQFVAAVNVSNNLGIPFAQLKTKMVTDGLSLGQAIQSLRPQTASPTIEAQRAEYDARGIIAETELQPTATTATTTTTSATTSKAKVKTKKPGQ